MEPVKPGLIRQLTSVNKFKTDYIGAVDSLYGEFGTSFTLTIPQKKYVFVDPEDYLPILKNNSGDVEKSPFFSQMKSLWGEGLLTQFGEPWKKQRKVSGPLFARNSISNFMEEMSADCWEYLESNLNTNGGNIVPYLESVALNNICELLFGFPIKNETDKLRWAINEVQYYSCRKYFSIFNFPEQIPTRRNVNVKIAVEIIRRSCQEAINHSATLDRPSFISRLKGSSHATYNDKQVIDQVINFLIAGHETIVSGLSWTLLLISQNPQYQSLINDELTEALRGTPATASDIGKLKLTQATIKEAMRLYPPIAFLSRVLKKEQTIGPYELEAGSMFSMPLWISHRLEKYWDEPSNFLPERFLDEDTAVHKVAYLPFGAGSFKCIGEHMAMAEMTLLLAQLCQLYEFELVGPPPKPEPLISVRPKGGLTLSWKQKNSRAPEKLSSTAA